MEKAKASNNQKMVLIERISSFIADLPAVLGHVGAATSRRRLHRLYHLQQENAKNC
jgi:hypothetical protein